MKDYIDATTDQTRGEKAHISIEQALGKLSSAAATTGSRSVMLFEHGTLQVKMYSPDDHDPQQPHSYDEIYVVARGEGIFFDGVARHNFRTGDLIFAPAGSVHRFENFTDDFSVWVMFYGPEGGEQPIQS